MHWCTASVFWQKRWVNIQAAKPRCLQNRLWNHLPIGTCQDEVRICIEYLLKFFAQRLWLQAADAMGITKGTPIHVRKVAPLGDPVELTFKEYELLRYMMINLNIVLTREAIMQNVWGTDFEGESRTLDMHIRSLRRKLGESGRYIRTVRNVGYVIDGAERE